MGCLCSSPDDGLAAPDSSLKINNREFRQYLVDTRIPDAANDFSVSISNPKVPKKKLMSWRLDLSKEEQSFGFYSQKIETLRVSIRKQGEDDVVWETPEFKKERAPGGLI